MSYPSYSGEPAGFHGFTSPSSNTTYTPNQFFDVCLPHRSRGCVRIVAYILRKTLGWSDEHGNPIHEQFAITYDELIRKAGVSREMIKTSLEEAIQFGFIQCLRPPAANRSGKRAVNGLYELRWDETDVYQKDPHSFEGFFAGAGNRTYIPNQFFDLVIRQEVLSVIKVVGSIIRFSIGFTTKWGHRRQHASMSLTDIQRYAKIHNRNNLVEAIRQAVRKHYIHQVDSGYFDKTGGRQSRSAVYSLRWLSDNSAESTSQKKIPKVSLRHEQSEKDTGYSQITIPAERSEIDTGIQITSLINNNLKQQSFPVSNPTSSDESVIACCTTLEREGFDEVTAQRLARGYRIDRVLNQIEWLPMRGPAKNRLGLLRRAIEQNYLKPEPKSAQMYGRPYSNSREEELRRKLAYQFTIKRS